MNVRAISDWGRLAVLLGVLAAIAGQAGLASAAGEDSTLLHIRARCRLQLRQTEAQSRKGKFTVGIGIELSDQPLASPGAESPSPEDLRWFASQHIELSLSGEAGLLQRVTVTTDRQGSATYSFARLPAGLYRVNAQYPGDEHRDAASESLDLHLDRFRSELSFSAPTAWGGDHALPISDLALRGKQGALPGLVNLSVFLSRDGKASGAALVQRPVQLAAPSDGGLGTTRSVELSVPPVPPGSVLVVRGVYAGDDDYAPAQLERELIVVTQAHVTLDAGPREVAQSAPLRISGTLFTTGTVGAGPLPGELVDIEANQAPEPLDSPSLPAGPEGATAPPSGGTIRRALGTTVSNADGRFVLDIPRLPLRVGATDLVARVVPARRYIRPAVSNEVRIVVTPPEPVSILFFVLPLVASAGLAGLYWLARALSPRLTAWLAARRARRRAELALASPSSSSSSKLDAVAVSSSSLGKIGSAGVSLGSRGALSLRRTIDNTVDGVVHDAAFGQAIVGATISLTPLLPEPTAQQRATETDGEGRFVLTQLRAGRCVVRVVAPGYQPQEFAANVPHRGEFRGITVRLLPLRVRLFSEWQRVALAYYGEAALVQTRTPQDFLRDAQEPPRTGPGRVLGLTTPLPSQGLPALRRLTALVEEAYYSSRICSDAMVQESERLAAGLLPTTTAGKSTDGLRAESGPRPLQ